MFLGRIQACANVSAKGTQFCAGHPSDFAGVSNACVSRSTTGRGQLSGYGPVNCSNAQSRSDNLMAGEGHMPPGHMLPARMDHPMRTAQVEGDAWMLQQGPISI